MGSVPAGTTCGSQNYPRSGSGCVRAEADTCVVSGYGTRGGARSDIPCAQHFFGSFRSIANFASSCFASEYSSEAATCHSWCLPWSSHSENSARAHRGVSTSKGSKNHGGLVHGPYWARRTVSLVLFVCVGCAKFEHIGCTSWTTDADAAATSNAADADAAVADAAATSYAANDADADAASTSDDAAAAALPSFSVAQYAVRSTDRLRRQSGQLSHLGQSSGVWGESKLWANFQ